MKFAVVGAGAIGAFAGAMLSRSGDDVTLIARGAHLKAMQERGVRVRGSLGEFEARPAATDDPSDVGHVDAVLLTVKAHSLTEMAPRLTPLIGPDTCVVSMQNGIPWWYFYRHGGEWEGTHLESVDPGGVVSNSIDPARVIGCVVYPSTIITEPGVVEHIEGTRFAIGEPDGGKSERCRLVADAFIKAGLRCPIRGKIRHDMWVKLMGSVAFNPISALTRSTLIEIVQCRETRALSAAIMAEAEAVAQGLGIDLGVSIEQRLEGAEKVGAHKTSMLQDVEAGRPLELEAIVGAVVELGRRLGVAMPSTEAAYACVKLLDSQLRERRRAV
ncbi:MAG TPA: 2-dehydropantoate 2-reductase [Blastocatellia bacterium]|jgi:2-dehydropantoate 2-reductase|nr:2-dehydropantoate 2-reductase [Blastocatellia bacterium]